MSPIPASTDLVARANAADRQPVIFIHGLWLNPSVWDRWLGLFEASGYAAIAPGWPAEAGGAMAPETIGEVATHFAGIANALDRRPAIIGHSLGGLIAQVLAGQGLSAATVAIDPGPFHGLLPLPPVPALRSAWSVLRNPANAQRQVGLTSEQSRYAFTNAASGSESEAPYENFQAPAAKFNPWTEARVDTEAAQRGALLTISGDCDDTLPPTLVLAAFTRQSRNPKAIMEFKVLPGRGHSLTIDAKWREVADIALAFVGRFV